MGTANGGQLLPLPASAFVDSGAARQLVDAARSLASSVATPGIGQAERLARSQRAADAARDVRDALPLLSPYNGGRHARVLDMASLNERRRNVDRDAAIERLARDRQYRDLARQMRAVQWVDVSPLHGSVPTPVPAPSSPGPSVTPWLDRYGVQPDEPLGPGRWLAGAWQNIPPAVIDPAPGDSIAVGGPATLPGGITPWHTSALAVDVAEQLEDWTVGGATEIEAMIECSVSLGLETVLLADLAAGAPTAADIPAALAAVTWPTGADLILTSGSDAPAVAASFGAAGQWPAPVPVLATGGVPAGTVLVLATSGTIVEASDTEWLTAVKPSLLGQDIAGLRYGLARVRQVGAVVAVDLTPVP